MRNRRRIGRAVMVAAVVAAITCCIGGFVAWRLLGDLRERSAASLELVRDTLINVDETLAIAQDVTGTVAGSIGTLRDSVATLSTSVQDATRTLEAIADLTEDVPTALDAIGIGLGNLNESAAVVDTALEELDDLPFGPNYDEDAGLAAAVDGVRADLQPITDDLRASTDAVRDLSQSGADVITQLSALDTDLTELDESLARSDRLLERYRADASRAVDLATQSLADLDRDIRLSRILTTILALTIAVGQIAPFHLGRQLANTPTPAAADEPDPLRQP